MEKKSLFVKELKKWIYYFYNKPIHYPRKLDINYFRNIKILNTNTPLYKDYKKAYEDYLDRYYKFEREKKLNEILK